MSLLLNPILPPGFCSQSLSPALHLGSPTSILRSEPEENTEIHPQTLRCPHIQLTFPVSSTDGHTGACAPPSSKEKSPDHFCHCWQCWGGGGGTATRSLKNRAIPSTRMHTFSHTCTHEFRCFLTRPEGQSRDRVLRVAPSLGTWTVPPGSLHGPGAECRITHFPNREFEGQDPCNAPRKMSTEVIYALRLPGRGWAMCER